MSSVTIKSALSNRVIILVFVTILCLVPFVGKAFHIDDPLFIWAGKQIQTNPFDFYGFTVNWYGWEMPMSQVTKNPPVACYYISLVGSLFGWDELGLHIAFMIPAVATVLGTYYLARQLCSQPALATLAAVLTPVFIVSGSNIMCDTMMLAFWVWAVFFWIRGIKTNNLLSLLFAAVLIAICALTKYFGMSLLALLGVYSLMEKRRVGVWVLFLLVPVVILAGYQWATYSIYGRGLLSDAVSYATRRNLMGEARFFVKTVTGLAFTGGCIITVLFFIPLVWRGRFAAVGILLTGLFIFALSFVEKIAEFPIHDINGIKWSYLIQLGLMTMGGLSLLVLAGADFWKSRDGGSLLLVLWVFGTFIFASFINWSVNARSILPMVPAAGILLVRRIDQRNKTGRRSGNWWLAWPLVPAAVIALSVGWADYAWAGTARSVVETVDKKFENRAGSVWFQGHWGFQYYMEAAGCKAIDFKQSRFASADIVIIPSNNTNIRLLSNEAAGLSEIIQVSSCRWLAIMNSSVGAAFYSDKWGLLPFVIGPAEVEKYYVFIVR